MGLSADGTWVLAARPDLTEWFLLPTRAGARRSLPRGPLAQIKDYRAGWLDASHIVLMGVEEGHGNRVYLQDVGDGTIRPLTPEGFSLPRHAAARPDGKAVLAAAQLGRQWSLFPVEGGDPLAIPALGDADEPLQWSADGRVLYVAHRSMSTPETAADVYRVEIATGRRDLFKKLSPPDPAGVEWIERIVLTPDGRSYCYTYRQTFGTLYVAEGLK
jgi:hypothetical protein